MAAQRIAVITGASAGIGKAAAIDLVGKGWRVIGVGRDPGRSAAADIEIRAAAKDGGSFAMLRGDLARLVDARRLAAEIAKRTDRIDVLLNNAGGMAATKVITEEGLEENFAGNHHGPFLLTNLLTPLLRAAAKDAPKGSVRIVNTSSNASEMIGALPWGDLARLDAFDTAGQVYCSGKLANVLHARSLAERLAGDGIVAHSFHPGTVATNFFSHTGRDTQDYMKTLDLVSPQAGADTLLWLATADAAAESSGGYWHKREPRAPNPLFDDREARERLWAESEEITSGTRVSPS
jgi:NAD(P)-dependent dehydrogenase (short-subunit alcohol dehydrogenase family)